MFFSIVAISCIVIVVVLLSLVLFEPPLRYAVTMPPQPLDSEAYVRLLGALADAQVQHANRIQIFKGGDAFYEAELQAIRAARQTIHWEAYLFHPSDVSQRIVDALAERAGAGVQVKLVLDAIGCTRTPMSYFHKLCQAGGRVVWYQPIRWYTLKRINNRTHRELIVIDGSVGFIGGAGVAAHWSVGDNDGKPPWVDMMCKVDGALAAGLQTCFSENWLEATGEILAGEMNFPAAVTGHAEGPTRGLVVVSTPSAGRSTRARILFQVLLASAARSITINSPYFLPDHSARSELIKAAKHRNVKVRIITPGKNNNHPITRIASRRIYGDLLRAGIEILEYEPGMIHKKCLIVDGLWTVVGSTNFDTRSFGLNDEVNLAALDHDFAQRLEKDFEDELRVSRPVSLAEWEKRSLPERLLEMVGRVLERQE